MVEAGKNQEGGVGLPSGTKIGKYELTDRLGAGGQSIVYKGYDALLDRYVAIKQISSHLSADPKFLERFRKEAQILARLGGEVITIHELVEDERGLFIVMEFVEGHTLETIIRETNGPIETKAALRILWRLAATLHEVHSAGIIHRDLKPGNIIIAEGLRPRITDFGVAASLTGQTSMLLGTTKYMAPEMYGDGGVDGRADIYSLGFIMYELLTGRPKFNEIFEEVVRDRHSEALRWMKWHGHDDAVAPPLHKINPAVPKALSKIVAKMIAKNPDDRFASMEELGRVIKSIFSPKARAAAAAKSVEDNLALRGRRALRVGAPSGNGEDALSSHVGDEADDLELPLEEPLTAPLPRSSLSLRTKLVLGGVIAASFLTIVFILVYQANLARRQRVRSAQEIYVEAERQFKSGKSEDLRSALAGFTDLGLARHAGTPQAAKASVLAPFCRAKLKVQEAEVAQRRGDASAKDLWKLAKTEEDEVIRLYKKLQQDRDDLDEWTRKVSDWVKAFARERVAGRIFVEGIVSAKGLFKAGQLDTAEAVLNDLTQGAALTDSQVAEVKSLRESIAVAKFKAKCDQQLARGAEILREKNLKNLSDAADVYRGVQSLVKGSGSQLSAADRKAYLDDISARLDAISIYTKYLQAMQLAAEARGRNNKRAELRAYVDARKNASTQEMRDELDGKITTIRADIAYDRGMHEKSRKRISQAVSAFKEAVRLNGHPQAKAELAAMATESKRDSLIAEGAVHFAAGKYTEALKKFQEAGRLAMDGELSKRMIDCRFQMQFIEAEKLRNLKQYDKAEPLYLKAAQIKPSERPRIDAIISQMQTRQRYEAHLADGDRALNSGEFSAALDFFRKAKAVLDTQEAQKRMDEVIYRENLAKGKDEMFRRNYPLALGYFNIARKAKDTAEVRDLIARTKQNMEK